MIRGQVVDGFSGILPEVQLRRWISRVLQTARQLGCMCSMPIAAPLLPFAVTPTSSFNGAALHVTATISASTTSDGRLIRSRHGHKSKVLSQQMVLIGDIQ